MNEIDLFINLLDNDGANFLLQKFKDNVKSDNLSLKRIKLKKIFKNVSNKAKGKRTNTNPFHFAISCFKNEAYEKFSRNELLETLRSDLQGVIPNYVKFANVLYFYNDIVVENMEKIIENYNNNVNLFKDIGEFKTIDEVEKFLLNDKMCKLHIKDVAIKQIKDDMDTSQKIKYDIIEPIIKDWDLVTFQNKLYEESQKNPTYLIQLAFLTTHKNKEEIENGIALNMLENYYDYKLKFFNEEYKKDIDELKKKIDSSEKTIEDLKNENEKLLKQNKQCKKELGTLENSIEVLKSKLKGYEEKTKKDKNSEGDNKENLSEIKLKNEELEKQLKEAKTMCKFLEKEIIQLQLERDELGKNLNYINAYFEYASSSIEENKNYLFALVINMDAKICSYLFPEILFIDSNKLEEELLSCSLNNINKIYIQRNNLSTLKINLIKEFAKKKRLKAKIIMPRNEKELIEEIIKIKYMEG